MRRPSKNVWSVFELSIWLKYMCLLRSRGIANQKFSILAFRYLSTGDCFLNFFRRKHVSLFLFLLFAGPLLPFLFQLFFCKNVP